MGKIIVRKAGKFLGQTQYEAETRVAGNINLSASGSTKEEARRNLRAILATRPKA